MTPYRSARVEGRPLDPSRPRFGLAGAAVGAVCAFAALMDLGLNHRFTRVDNILLFGGSAAIALLMAYSALEAPAGRNAMFAAVGVFVFSFVPQLLVHEWMGEWVWGVRYLGLGAIAAALLVRLRRTRPGSYGFFLRGAAIVGTWWGLLRTVALTWTYSQFDGRSELFSRVVYLLLAAGMIDVRRFVGAPPMREPVRTSMHTAREVATTRVCLALLLLGATLSATTYTWHSEWNVIASADGIGAAIALGFHLPWVARTRGLRVAVVLGSFSLLGLALGWRGFDSSATARIAIVICGAVAIGIDLCVVRFAAASNDDPDARSTHMLGNVAAFLHVLAAVAAVARVS